MIQKSTGHWGARTLPEVKLPVETGIFQKIATIAAVAIPLRTSPPPNEPPLTDSEESDFMAGESDPDCEDSAVASQESSGWESDDSSEKGTNSHPLTLDLDTGEATFSTS